MNQQTSAIGSQSFVERNGVSLGVLPVGDAGRDLPRVLVDRRQLARRRVKNRNRGVRRTFWNALCFEFSRLHGIHLRFHHANDALLGVAIASVVVVVVSVVVAALQNR
jgi:hypothetical protein